MRRCNGDLLFAAPDDAMPRMKWIALLVLLSGCCSTVTLPPPKVSTAEFTVTTYPNDLYLISYKGTAPVPSERLLDLALLKASLVARQHEHKYFVIIDQAASRTGEMKYRTTAPSAGDWNNELMIQGFDERPDRVFAFLSEGTEHAIYEKLRTSREPDTL